MNRRSIFLRFADASDHAIRARLSYALRVFAAVYGYTLAADASSAAVLLQYGEQAPTHPGQKVLRVPTLYKSEPGVKRRVHRTVGVAGGTIPLFFGLEQDRSVPDWLGEIFVWLSGETERDVVARDAVGRVPFSETIFARESLSPFRPYASLLMAWLESAIQRGADTDELIPASSPAKDASHLVMCSHDIDYVYTKRTAALRRLAKNLGISIAQQSPSFFASNCATLLKMLTGLRPGAYVAPMLQAIEGAGFRSTLFVVAEGAHRRDPEYALADVTTELRDAVRRGFSVGLHGSYCSLAENGSLPEESARLQEALGTRAQGGRQHWLRFAGYDALIRAVAAAGFAYDSSLGFAETCGFRNGASFAFPPYDFEREEACDFLEIPLAVMDGSLIPAARQTGKTAQEVMDLVLSESRRWGWGGISVLWHNPMEPIQVPEEVNRVFWKSASERAQRNERWTSVDEFLSVALGRYQAAGLLKEVRCDA